MKHVTLTKHTHESLLGSATFKAVPAYVRDDSDVRQGAKLSVSSKDEYFIAGNIIEIMEREVARKWLVAKLDAEDSEMSGKELRGVALALGFKNADIATLLDVSRGNVTKMMHDDSKIYTPQVKVLMAVLAKEIMFTGAAKEILDGKLAMLIEVDREPKTFDTKKRA